MMETLTISSRPIFNTHSNLITFSLHPRNVQNSFVRALADRGGLLGLSVYKNFVQMQDCEASIALYCHQIQHCSDRGGDDVVWFESDYHGLMMDDIVFWCEKIFEIDRLYDAVIDLLFGCNCAEKFFAGNDLRALEAYGLV